LPGLVAALADQWQVRLEAPFAEIKMNYVAPGVTADGTPCVLKVSRYIGETRTEIAALRLWDGVGVPRLLEADPERGALLMERAVPGTMLVSLDHDDDTATLVAAEMLRQLWRPLPERHELRSLASWCAAYERNRAALTAGADGFPRQLFERGDALRAELLATPTEPTVLHGDLHHFNILRSDRAGWLAVDPKGLAGDRAFDVCQFLRNPTVMPLAIIRRRLDILCAELGLDRQRVNKWCVVHAVLDASWDFEDRNPEMHGRVAYAESLLEL
jgi:streptomycin 6-kinase